MILLTGATGYVGGRLLQRLEERAIRVRCLTRHPGRLAPFVAETTQVAAGDVLDAGGLEAAMAGVEVAYYLVHSMGAGADFEEHDRRGARNFAAAARKAGVSRIIYLGGLGQGGGLSAHLASRQEVGRLLRESGVPVVELRASVIIGPGSLSFEMVRALVERLPVMITPRWVRLKAQPIAIDDVIAYLVGALDLPEKDCRVYEIGGRDVVGYEDIMAEYARQRGLRRLLIPVPVLTPRLSSLWLGLVTPLYARVGRQLFTSLRNTSIVEDPRALTTFSVKPLGLSAAIAKALADEDREYAAARWTRRPPPPGQRFVDSRSLTIPASARAVFGAVLDLGGGQDGCVGLLWSIRRAVDSLLGGVGTRRGLVRGRPIRVGDTLDSWRVEAVENDRLLRLRSEMKLPGRAWLQFEICEEDGGSRLVQTAVFEPRGLPGFLYWHLLHPAHELVFRGMLRGIMGRSMLA